MNWKSWLTGLVWAVLSSVGSGLTFMLTDPEHFNFSTGWKALVGVSLAFGLQGGGLYLKKSAPPDPAKDAINPSRFAAPVLILIALGSLVACHQLGRLDQAIYDATKTAVDVTESLCLPDAHHQCTKAGGLTSAQFHTASVVEHDVSTAGSAFTALLVAGTAKPTDAADLLKALETALATLRGIPQLTAAVDALSAIETRIRAFMGTAAPAPGGF